MIEPESANMRTRARQLVLILIGGALALGAMLVVDRLARPAPETVAGGDVTETSYSRVDGVAPEVTWAEEGARDIERNKQRISALEKHLDEAGGTEAQLLEKIASLEAQLDEQEREAKAVIDAQAAAIRQGAGDVDAAGDPFAGLPPTPSPGTGPATVPSSAAPVQDDPFMASGSPGADSPGADPLGPLGAPTSLIRFELTPRPGTAVPDDAGRIEDVKDTAFYLPSGAHAPAVITTGAAASVSVTGQADPRPVLMRITGRAMTASDGRGDVLEADIRGCTLTGEARGDLSSERVYVRLRTMTCRRGRGVVETAVQGFVAGTGQAGVRGTVITREGDLVEKSALAGVLSGFGGAAAQGLRPPSVVGTTVDGTVRRPADSEVLANAGKAGLAQGIGNAGDRLAQYYISRAEQYQPVVSLKGGTPVEVVFIAGTYLDGRGLDGRAGGERDGPVSVSAQQGGG